MRKAANRFLDREGVQTAIFLVVVTVAAHYLLSWIGFNPTDDGFTLAYSRRLLEGEVPHRDFIIIRPFLSPLMHTPFVLLGGQYALWLARMFVWFQLACIAWLWTVVVNKLSGNPFTFLERCLVALVSFAVSAHQFPLMPWHTIDGLFLVSLGLVLCMKDGKRQTFFGYVLIAAAYLCKQSFIFMAPAVLIILGDWRSIRYWGAVVLPAVLYGMYLLFTGALHDAFIQLTAQTDFLRAGVLSYTQGGEILEWIIVGWVGAWLLRGIFSLSLLRKIPLQKIAGAGLLAGLPLVLVFRGLSANQSTVIAFLLFGMVLGVTLYCAAMLPSPSGYNPMTVPTRSFIQALVLVLLAAWSASLSLGYNTPALGAGSLVTVLIALVYAAFRSPTSRKTSLWLPTIHTRGVVGWFSAPGLSLLLLIATAVIMNSFSGARHEFVYREASASLLTYPLGDVFPGGSNIMTNQHTYEFLHDLKDAVALVKEKDKRYAILPDIAGYWAKAGQANPLPIDWAQSTELNSKALVDRVVDALDKERGNTIVIVQKVHADDLVGGFVPLPPGGYSLPAEHVQTTFKKIGETKYFVLYS